MRHIINIIAIKLKEYGTFEVQNQSNPKQVIQEDHGSQNLENETVQFERTLGEDEV